MIHASTVTVTEEHSWVTQQGNRPFTFLGASYGGNCFLISLPSIPPRGVPSQERALRESNTKRKTTLSATSVRVLFCPCSSVLQRGNEVDSKSSNVTLVLISAYHFPILFKLLLLIGCFGAITCIPLPPDPLPSVNLDDYTVLYNGSSGSHYQSGEPGKFVKGIYT